MKIRKLQLKNIGVFDDETIEFQPCPVEDKAEIHIFTGQNGSGKTTALQALASLFLLNFNEVDNSLSLNAQDNQFIKRFRSNYLSNEIGFVLEDGNFNQKYNFQITKENDKSYVQMVHKYPKNPLTQKLEHFLYSHIENKKLYYDDVFSFAAFAYSGYRRVKSEKIKLFDDNEENPLNQALDFFKDENSTFTVNQWLGRNLSKRALALEDNSKESKRFTENIQSIEKILAYIIGYELRFKLRTDLSLVLIKDNQELDFDVLPDGLKSLIGWIGDLLMRLDSLDWEINLSIFEREIILFLDEIEVHLHPAWQRKVLPVVQKLFKNAQIFVSTHSPFVVNSVDDAWVYKLELENGKARVAEVVESENSNSITQVLREVFGIEEWFGLEVQDNLERFKELKNKIILNGADENVEKELLEKAKILADEPSDQLKQIIKKDLEELSEIKNKPYAL